MVKKKDEQPEDDDKTPFSKPPEWVDRPYSSRAKWGLDEELKMLKESIDNGKAIRLSVKRIGDLAHLQMAIRYATSHKLRAKLRYKLASQDTIIVWAEKVKGS